MYQILVIEDYAESQQLVALVLSGDRINCVFASNGKEARELLTSRDFHLILLDVHLPDVSGFDLFLELKQNPRLQNIPVIFLTGAGEPTEKVAAFSLGAEDYIVKPFNSLEFRARIEAKLKKTSAGTMPFTRGEVHIDPGSQKAFRLGAKGEKADLGLTHLEFQLLSKLAQTEEQVFSREQLLRAAWGENTDVYDRTVDVHICSLRKKLGPCSYYLEAVHNAGYRFFSGAKKAAKSAA